MHNNLPKIYYFINEFDQNHIRKLNKNIALIYRNYEKKVDEKLIKQIKKFCKIQKRKLFLSNNLKIALKLNLDGVYIPSFNKNIRLKNYSYKKKFIIIGSAHNIREIKEKEKQGAQAIFISPLFNKKKKYLGLNKFRNLSKFTKKKIIALGGINQKNIKKLKLLNIYGYAAINLFDNAKKKAPKKLGA